MPYTDKIAEISFKDVQFGSTWKISIFDRDAYAGAVIDLVLTGRPVQLSYGGKGDLLDCVHGSELSINILAGPTDDYDWIKTTDSKKYAVIAYLDTVIYWVGYVLPGKVVESYQPYRVIIVPCTDRLKLLADVPYALAGVNYEGYDTYINILSGALSYTGLSLKIRSVVNLFESAMATAITDDPLAQASANQNRFINDDQEPSSCLTVIEECLRSLKCRIFQSQGVWYIVRTVEYEGTALPYRQFSSAGAYEGQLSISPQRTITDISGSPRFMLMRGTQVEQGMALKTYSIKQDYGLRQSLLMGWNFTAKEWDSATTLKHFTISATSEWIRITSKGETFMFCPTTGYGAGKYFESDIIPVIASGSVSLQLNVVGGMLNTVGKIRVYFMVTGISDTYYWNGTAWTTSIGTGWKMPFAGDVPYGSTDLNDVDHISDIDAWPVDGDFKIVVFDSTDAAWVKKIIVTGKTSITVGMPEADTTKIDIDTNNPVSAQEETMILIDNNSDLAGAELFYDGLIRVGEIPSVGWKVAGTIGYYKLWEWAAQYQIDQRSLPSLTLRANILGQYHYYQSIVVPGLGSKIFVPDDVQIDLRSNEVSGTWIEVKATSLAVAYTESTDSVNVAQSIGVSEKSGLVTKITTSGKMFIEQSAPIAPILKSVASGGGSAPALPDTTRAGSASVASGPQTVTFTESFPVGSDYVISPIWGLDSGGSKMDIIPYNKTVGGFDVDCYEAVTFDYIAIIKR